MKSEVHLLIITILILGISALDILHDEHANYPTDEIDSILGNSKGVFKSFFGRVTQPVDDGLIGNKDGINDGEGDSFLCRSKVRVKRPLSFSAQGSDEEFIVIQSKNQNLYQEIVYETCGEYGNSHCEAASYRLPHDYNTTCVQKYNQIKLLCLSKDKKKMTFESATVPSHCACEWVKKFDD